MDAFIELYISESVFAWVYTSIFSMVSLFIFVFPSSLFPFLTDPSISALSLCLANRYCQKLIT